MHRLFLAVILGMRMLVVPCAAGAQPKMTPAQQAQARELRKKGKEYFEEKNYAEALSAYRQSYEISRDPVLLYNMGLVLQALNELPEALTKFEEFSARTPADLKSKIEGFEQTLAEIRSKVTTLTISSNVSGARVLLRKKEIGRTPIRSLRVLAGEAEIELLAEDHEPLFKKLVLPGGGTQTLELTMTPKSKDKAPPMGPASPEATRSRWWLWAGLGVVLVSGIVLTTALLTERDSDKGTFQTGQRAVPLLRFLASPPHAPAPA